MLRLIYGAQFGDEGKGKVCDWFCRDATVAARYNGGPNAGNTVQSGQNRVGFRMLPAGALRPGITCVLGRGVVIDRAVLEREVRVARRVNPDLRVIVDPRAHLITAGHIAADAELEALRPIGSTRTGVGPAYADRVLRTGVPIGSLAPSDLNDVCEVAPVAGFVRSAYLGGGDVVVQGAHGVMLDIAHGFYPYTTSSGCLPSDAGSGLGLDIRRVDEFVGVIKPYISLVGRGPVHWEITDSAAGREIARRGAEKGTVTGRPRRIAWLDLRLLSVVANQMPLSYWAVTHLDALDGLERVGLVVHDRVGNPEPETLEQYRASPGRVRYLPGWPERPSHGVTYWRDLPGNARRLLSAIHDYTGVRVEVVSTGPDRASTALNIRGDVQEQRRH